MKGLIKYLLYDKWRLVLAVLLAIIGNLLALVGPMLSGKAVDAIEPGKGNVDFDTVFFYAGCMIVFYLLPIIFSKQIITFHGKNYASVLYEQYGSLDRRFDK